MTPQNPVRHGGQIIRREDCSDWLEGSAHLEKARKELEEARQQAVRIKEEAYAQGYRDGQLAGMREVERLIHETQAAIKTFESGLDGHVLNLALAISRKIVGSVDVSETIAHGAADAIASFKENANLTLFVPPALYERIKSKLQQLLSARGGKVLADPELGEGQAFLSADTGSVDLSVPAQMEVVEKRLILEIAGDHK